MDQYRDIIGTNTDTGMNTTVGTICHGTGGRWSDRAKAAYKSWRDYIIAVKGKIRLRVTLSTQSESAAFRRISLISSSGDLGGVVHDGVTIALCIVPLKVVGLWLKEDPDLYFSWWQNAAEFCLG